MLFMEKYSNMLIPLSKYNFLIITADNVWASFQDDQSNDTEVKAKQTNSNIKL